MMRVDRPALEGLTPLGAAVYHTMFAEADVVLEPYGVLANGRRLAHFLAQCLHETGGLTILMENLNYRAERLRQVWPKRFPTLASALPFAHHPRALANKVYMGRLGNYAPDDGWRYRGRGLLQLTGRDSYRRIGEALGLGLVDDPELVLAPAHGLRVAGETWWQAQCNIFADADNLEGVTRAINGGLIGLASRADWLAKAWEAVALEG